MAGKFFNSCVTAVRSTVAVTSACQQSTAAAPQPSCEKMAKRETKDESECRRYISCLSCRQRSRKPKAVRSIASLPSRRHVEVTFRSGVVGSTAESRQQCHRLHRSHGEEPSSTPPLPAITPRPIPLSPCRVERHRQETVCEDPGHGRPPRHPLR